MSIAATVATRRKSWAWIAAAPASLLTIVFVLLPFTLALWNSFVPEGRLDATAYTALLDSAFLTVLRRTVGFAVLLSAACIVLGVTAAYALVRCAQPVRRLLLTAINLSFFAGILVRSYAWLAIFGHAGPVNWLLHLLGHTAHVKLSYTFPVMFLACMQIELPLFILPLYGVMRGVDRSLQKAAQSLGADPLTAWITAFLPLVIPGIFVSTALVFLTALGFYAAPTLLGPPDTYMLAQELEVRINTLGDESGAGARIVVMLALIVIAAAVFACLYRWARARASSGRGLRFGGWCESLAQRLSPWRWLVAGTYIGAVIVLLLAPMLMLPALAFNGGDFMGFPPHSLSLRWFHAFTADEDLRASTCFSLQVSLLSAAIASVAGAAAALTVRHLQPRASGALALLSCVPLVVSSITVTAGLYIVALRLPWIDPSWLFVAVYSVLGLPFSYLLVRSAYARLDANLPLAAASLGASPWTTARTVTLPILAPSFISAFVFSFLLAFDDVSAGLFLSTSERMPLAMRLWETLKFSITPMPAAIALLGFAAGFVLYGSVRLGQWAKQHSWSRSGKEAA